MMIKKIVAIVLLLVFEDREGNWNSLTTLVSRRIVMLDGR